MPEKRGPRVSAKNQEGGGGCYRVWTWSQKSVQQQEGAMLWTFPHVPASLLHEGQVIVTKVQWGWLSFYPEKKYWVGQSVHLGFPIFQHMENPSKLFGQPYACVYAKLLQSYLTLCDSMDRSPPGSSVLGIFQARILEWVAMPSTRRSSQHRDWTHISRQQAGSLPWVPPGKPGQPNKRMLFLLWGWCFCLWFY